MGIVVVQEFARFTGPIVRVMGLFWSAPSNIFAPAWLEPPTLLLHSTLPVNNMCLLDLPFLWAWGRLDALQSNADEALNNTLFVTIWFIMLCTINIISMRKSEIYDHLNHNDFQNIDIIYLLRHYVVSKSWCLRYLNPSDWITMLCAA